MFQEINEIDEIDNKNLLFLKQGPTIFNLHKLNPNNNENMSKKWNCI